MLLLPRLTLKEYPSINLSGIMNFLVSLERLTTTKSELYSFSRVKENTPESLNWITGLALTELKLFLKALCFWNDNRFFVAIFPYYGSIFENKRSQRIDFPQFQKNKKGEYPLFE